MIKERLIRWFIFSVLIALLPIGFNALKLVSRGCDISLVDVTKHGELLLIASAICAAAIGDLVTSGAALKNWKAIVAGCCLIVLCLSSFYFADISASVDDESLKDDVVSRMSIILFAIAMISSAGCIVLSEINEDDLNDG